MLKLKRVTDIYSMRVFTDSGDYFGDVEEAVLTKTKITAWRVKATKTSALNKLLGSAKGVIVPHQLIKSVGDVIIISKSAIPSYGEEAMPTEASTATQ
ncbi:photosystem reaction center subunit H [Candidatus Woesearchaeota archaeon]|nr:photosystem reaction center subunit H [Candidatus Woesearchaeota archaeon]|tara:strand:- start:102 stop:395 length:294 start_codon:yes stop_codon:yes gene_type:complete